MQVHKWASSLLEKHGEEWQFSAMPKDFHSVSFPVFNVWTSTYSVVTVVFV